MGAGRPGRPWPLFSGCCLSAARRPAGRARAAGSVAGPGPPCASAPAAAFRWPRLCRPAARFCWLAAGACASVGLGRPVRRPPPVRALGRRRPGFLFRLGSGLCAPRRAPPRARARAPVRRGLFCWGAACCLLALPVVVCVPAGGPRGVWLAPAGAVLCSLRSLRLRARESPPWPAASGAFPRSRLAASRPLLLELCSLGLSGCSVWLIARPAAVYTAGRAERECLIAGYGP